VSAEASLNEPLGEALLGGDLTAEQAVLRCLARIEETDGATRSFVSLRADQALAEARARDAGPSLGP
jgi:Asp-tRNA(Asn)/Glu-tRNA(Gln) amidotransferase A subunit family amidase